jgi:transcriptional regulator with XRE-family HTH domain/mannose-6-phosphate isomerase-like protein (cupin superfamily)
MSGDPTAEKTRTTEARVQPPGHAEPIVTIGQQLREARVAVGLSVREMARRVDVSASFISQLELGKTMPSVGTLYSIASELGVSLDDLMRAADSRGDGDDRPLDGLLRPTAVASAGPTVNRAEPGADLAQKSIPTALRRASQPGNGSTTDSDWPVQRAACRQELRIGGAVWGRLTADHDPANDFLHVLYRTGGESCPADQMIHHRGYEYGYIISGTLHIQVGFAHYDLGVGDSISFDSATPHRLSNPFDEESESIWVVVGRGGTPVL